MSAPHETLVPGAAADFAAEAAVNHACLAYRHFGPEIAA